MEGLLSHIPPSWRGDRAGYAAMGVLGLLVPCFMQFGIDFPAPPGSDPGLWELSAMNITVGAPSAVAPLYPALVAGVVSAFHLHVVHASQVVTALAFFTLVPLSYRLARGLGARPCWAVLGALLVYLHPRVAPLSLKCQADALTALVFTAGALATLAVFRRPSFGNGLALAAVTACSFYVREQGLTVTVPLLLVAAAAPGAIRMRAGRVLGGCALLILLPLAWGASLELPWQHPWFAHRVGEAVTDAHAGIPTYIDAVDETFKQAYLAAERSGNRLIRTWLVFTRSLDRNGYCWVWVAVGFLSLVRLRGARLLAPLPILLPGLSALVIFAEPRHVAVLLPVAGAAWAAAATGLGRWLWRAAALGAGLLALGVGLLERDLAVGETWGQSVQRASFKKFGEELCSHLEPGAIVAGGGAPRRLAWCPLVRQVRPVFDSPLEWKLVWMGDMPRRMGRWSEFEERGWARLKLRHSREPVYRLKPELTGEERPCYHSLPTGTLAYLGDPADQEMELEPPCSVGPRGEEWEDRRPRHGQAPDRRPPPPDDSPRSPSPRKGPPPAEPEGTEAP